MRVTSLSLLAASINQHGAFERWQPFASSPTCPSITTNGRLKTGLPGSADSQRHALSGVNGVERAGKVEILCPPKAGQKGADSDSPFARLLADTFSEDTVNPFESPSELLSAHGGELPRLRLVRERTSSSLLFLSEATSTACTILSSRSKAAAPSIAKSNDRNPQGPDQLPCTEDLREHGDASKRLPVALARLSALLSCDSASSSSSDDSHGVDCAFERARGALYTHGDGYAVGSAGRP